MLRYIVFVLTCLIGFNAYGQCDGNLGENIFTNGDFGSGAINILTPDPQIAPGYTYETSPPPIDGSYCISNNTTNWGSFANPNWANITDNSDDPNGYMMVVNASYDPGLFYEQTVDGLCENTNYYFSADIYNLADGIRPNVSFLIDGTNQYDTGDVPLNGQWNTYGFSFTTNPGQTTVVLALQNNAPGGDGNDIALDNISFRACGPEATIETNILPIICENGNTPVIMDAVLNGTQFTNPAIQWQESSDGGTTWIDIPGANAFQYSHTNSAPGVYYYRYLLASNAANLASNKCRVLSVVQIVEVTPLEFTLQDTICQGLEYTFNGQILTQAGTYVETFTTDNGCDSVVTLELEVVADVGFDVYLSSQDPECHDSNNGYIALDSIIGSTGPYGITINGDPHPTGNLSLLAGGTFNYIIEDAFGCQVTEEVTIASPPEFSIELGEDLEIGLGEEIELNPIYSLEPANYEWSYITPIECDLNCTFIPTNSGFITLDASTADGCSDSDSIYIQVFKESNIYIPNAFTPNEDGYNDLFTVYADANIVESIEKMQVYNRWGSLVYDANQIQPNSFSEGWDGKYKSKPVNPGTYVYWVRIRYIDGTVEIYEGDITLIR